MDLQNAIRHLELKLGTVIDLEVLHPAFAEMPELQLAPDQYHHHGDFCRWAKKQPGGLSVCSANKAHSRKIALRGRPFWGFCPKGVWDYAHPVIFEGNLAAIIYLGYLLPPGQEFASGWNGRRPGELSRERRSEIARYAAFLGEYVILELESYRESRGGCGKKRGDEFYMEQCRHFIERSYHQNPALSDLAEILHVNVNYLGGVIRRAGGKGFRELLSERRMQEAELLLRHYHRKYSIGEIGRRCGFSDSNYFCTVFKSRTGMSPREFIHRCAAETQESQPDVSSGNPPVLPEAESGRTSVL